MQTDEKSFFIYYMSKFGGKRDPSLLVEMIETLKEWLPKGRNLDAQFDVEWVYYEKSGWNEYRSKVVENLK